MQCVLDGVGHDGDTRPQVFRKEGTECMHGNLYRGLASIDVTQPGDKVDEESGIIRMVRLGERKSVDWKLLCTSLSIHGCS